MAEGKGHAWEDFQDLCLGGSLCVPATWSRRSWESQYCIPDADKDINFAVQLWIPRRSSIHEMPSAGIVETVKFSVLLFFNLA